MTTKNELLRIENFLEIIHAWPPNGRTVYVSSMSDLDKMCLSLFGFHICDIVFNSDC